MRYVSGSETQVSGMYFVTLYTLYNTKHSRTYDSKHANHSGYMLPNKWIDSVA